MHADAFDPFSPTRSLSRVLNWMDQLVDAPFVGSGGGWRRGWDVKEDESALYLRMDMPGLSKEDVKVSVEHNTLIIKGEAKHDDDDVDEESGQRSFSSRLNLPSNIYKLDSIRATMNNGVLKLMIPKVTDEEKTNYVCPVQIE